MNDSLFTKYVISETVSGITGSIGTNVKSYAENTILYNNYDSPETYLNCFTPSLCDDPRDTYYIRLGAIIYDSLN